MSAWIYKKLATSTHMDQVDDAQLARMIKGGGLTGTELIRPAEGAGEWLPLHSLPVFRETLRLPAGTDLAKVAGKRKDRQVGAIIGLITSLTMVGGVGGFLSAYTGAGNPAPGIVVMMGIAAIAMFGAGLGMSLAGRKGAPRSGETIRAPAAQPHRVDEVERSLAALEAALKSAPESIRSAIPVASLQESARRLKKNRELLASLPADEAKQALNAELDAARVRAAASTEAGASDAFADQIRGIEAHLRSIDGATAAIAETEARARALLHEVEALRVDVLRAGTDSTLDDELLERLHAIRRELEAESAIEQQLSQSAPAQRAMGPNALKS